MSEEIEVIVGAEPTPAPTPAPTPTPEPQLSAEQVEQIQKKAFGHILGQLDAKLAEIGFPKPDGVKTTDFVVELITKKGETSGTKDQPQKVDDTELGAKVKELQSMLRQKESELEQVKTSVTVQKRDFWVDSIINSAQIETPDYLSEQERARMEKRARTLMKNELTTNYDIKEVDGQFRFYQKDGSLVHDGTIDLNPISPSALIEREFSEFLKKAQKAPTPTKGTGQADAQQAQAEPVERVIPSKVKTASEFYTYLREDLKLTLGSKEFMDKITLAKKERPAMFN